MCPDPSRSNPPCFWECPDPTDPSTQYYHTNFALDLSGDQVYLIDTEANKHGIIHAVEYNRARGELPLELNQSISLIPDGDREGCFIVTSEPTPGDPNTGECTTGATFRRGDATTDGNVDITDAVFTLNWLFQGGQTPSCMDAADSDDSGAIDLTDAILVLNWLFLGGREPPAPGPRSKGPDPSDDDLADCVYNAE